MHRSLPALSALSLSLAALAAPMAAGAQARVAEQKIVGPPAPEAVLAGEPAAPPAAASGKKALSPMESALRTAAKDLHVASTKGMLVHPESGARIPAGASEAVLSLMAKPSGEADAQVRNALMMSGNSRESVDHLMLSLPELVSDPSSDRVRSAQKNYDEFMNAASESFRTNPPAEAMALDAILTRMSNAESGVRGDEKARKEDRKTKKSDPKSKKAASADRKSDSKPAANDARKASSSKSPAKQNGQKPSLWRRMLPFV